MNRKEKIQARAQRHEKRERTQRQHFTEGLTGPRARHIAKAETNLAYGETLRQNAGLIRGSKLQEQQVGDWYNTFANQLAESRGQVQGAYNAAQAQIAATMGTASANDASRQAALAGQDAQFAQLTGAPQNTSGPSTNAAAAGQRDLYGAALAAPVSAQGANAFAYLTNQRSTAQGEGISQRIKAQRRTRGYQEDRKALLKEKGNYRATKLDELRKGERDYKIQQAATGLNKKQFGEERNQNAIGQRNKERELGQADRSLNQAGRAAKESANSGGSSGSSSSPGGKTQSERNDARAGKQNAWQQANALYHSEAPPSTNSEWAKFQAHLASESEISPAEAAWAVKRLRQQIANRGTGNKQGEVHR